MTIQTLSIPLQTDSDGVIRIGKTRVTLDTLVAAFDEGATPEEIVHQYPSLELPDVYSVIGYYLRNKAEVDTYLQQRKTEASDVRAENEKRFDPGGVRARLLARSKKS